MAGAALQVADLVQREQNALYKFGAFGQDRVDHIRAGIFEAGQIGETLNSQYFVENELHIANGGGVAWHFRSLIGWKYQIRLRRTYLPPLPFRRLKQIR